MSITYAEGRVILTADEDDTGKGKYLIQGIQWSGATDGDSVELQDQDDTTIWKATADAGELNKSISFVNPIQVEQIKTAVLDSGDLIVYI